MPTSAEVWYLDSSALVKTIIEEPESTALRDWLAEREQLAACDLVRVEAVRAVRLADPAAVRRARRAIDTLTLIRLDDDIYDTAAELEPAGLRSLDAIHLAAAQTLGADLDGIATYDKRLAAAAEAVGVRVEAPGC